MPRGGLPIGQPGLASDIPYDQHNSVDEEKRLRALNAERQKSLVSDTNKLLKLAQELEAEVSSESPGSLDAAQLRKIAEIEKLARSVKEKMSTSMRPTAEYMVPSIPTMQ
jgi:hypothetical protein